RLPGTAYPVTYPFGRDRLLLYAYGGSTVLTCNLRGEVLQRLDLDAPIQGVAVSRDQRQFVTMPLSGGTVQLWTRDKTEPIELAHVDGSSFCHWADDDKTVDVTDHSKRNADGKLTAVVFDRDGIRLGEIVGPLLPTGAADRILRSGDEPALLDGMGKILAELPALTGKATWSRDGTRFIHRALAKDEKPAVARLFDRDGKLLARWPDTWASMVFSEPARVVTTPKGGAPALRDENGTLLKQLEGGTTVHQYLPYRKTGQSERLTARTWITVAADKRTMSIRDLQGEEIVSFTAVERPRFARMLGERVLVQEGAYAVLRDLEGAALRKARGTGYLWESGLVSVRTEDGSLQVFDLQGREALTVRSAARPGVRAFSHDGRHAFTTSADGVARVYDLQAPPILRFEPKTATITGAQVMGNGTQVGIRHGDGRFTMFDLSGKRVFVVEHDKREGEGTIAPSLVFSSKKQDRLLSLAPKESSARLWDNDGNVLSRFEDLEVIWAQFLDEDRLLTCSTVEKGPPRTRVRMHVWDRNGKSRILLGTFATGSKRYFPASALPKGKGFLTMSDEPERVQLLDGDGRFVAKLDTPGELEIVRKTLYRPARGDGERFLVGSHDETTWYVTLFDLRGRRVGEPLAFDSLRYVIPAVKPDRFITHSLVGKREYELWNFDGERIAPLRLPTGTYPRFFGGERLLAYKGGNQHTELFDLDGKTVGRLPGTVYSLRVDAERRRMVSWTSQTPVVPVWDFDGNELARLIGHTSKPTAVLSEDKQRIVTYAQDKTIRLWTWEGELLLTLTGPAGVGMASLTPDGKHVLALYEGGEVLLWPIDLQEIKRRAAAAAYRDFTPGERARYPRLLQSR
ncbi:MAG: WD40 repeat domain-containing protein, partial [Planctomycetota bacterium]|nr:WD40 repeat domain-containing protein [Planctomycetota bacterium]